MRVRLNHACRVSGLRLGFRPLLKRTSSPTLTSTVNLIQRQTRREAGTQSLRSDGNANFQDSGVASDGSYRHAQARSWVDVDCSVRSCAQRLRWWRRRLDARDRNSTTARSTARLDQPRATIPALRQHPRYVGPVPPSRPPRPTPTATRCVHHSEQAGMAAFHDDQPARHPRLRTSARTEHPIAERWHQSTG